MIFFNFWAALQWYLRPFIKWFLRKTTRLCELQRICYGDKVGAQRTTNIENSLILSRTQAVKEVVSYLDSAATDRRFVPANFPDILDPSVAIIVRVKKINAKLHVPFLTSFRRCLEQIWSYKQLVNDVEEMRKTQFDSNNPEHESKLLTLWSLLVPNETLESRVTKQWQDIGFQIQALLCGHSSSLYNDQLKSFQLVVVESTYPEDALCWSKTSEELYNTVYLGSLQDILGDDPKTDFRGMGLLGLENLLFFAREYSQASSHVLSHSKHPKYGYTFAIVGINLTSMAYYLLKDGSAKTYMFNAKQYLPTMNLFHRFYCYLFYEFDKMWIESKPQNIMEFSMIFKKFENAIRLELADPASVFRINIEIDTI